MNRSDRAVTTPWDDLRRRALDWITGDPDPACQAEVAKLIETENIDELRDRFAGALAFGTAGLRGLMGAGPNRMNRAVVLRATFGLAVHLTASVNAAAKRGVVVGYDRRHLRRPVTIIDP